MTTKNTSKLIVSITSKELSTELISREARIRVASRSFYDIGENLNVICNEDLYKERGFTSFESYVETFFDITRDYAYKMINAYRVNEILKSSGYKPSELPINEAQCRPMTALDDKDILPVWAGVIAKDTRITAKLIKELCDKAMGKIEVKKDTPVLNDNVSGDDIPVDPSSVTPGQNIEVGPVINGEKMYTEQEMGILKGQLAEAKQRCATMEAKLLAERQTGGTKVSKMGREMINAGFKALAPTLDADQQKELLEIKKALLQ